jgi:hypothetical protein
VKNNHFFILLFLLFLASCGKSLENQIDQQIRTLDNLDLDKDSIEILSIEDSGQYAIAEVSVKTAVKMKRDGSGWVLEEVRLGDGKWEKVDRIIEALNLKRSEETVEKMEIIQAGIRLYQTNRGELPRAQDFRELVDLINPIFMNEVIRTDGWWNSFSFRLVDKKSFELRSAGPDRQFYTTDDIVSTG